MYKIQVQSNAHQLHTVFKAKLKMYGFIKVGEKSWVSNDTVEDLMGVMFYKKKLCGPMSPLTVTAKRTERIA